MKTVQFSLEKEIPVVAEADVLVVGGGPGGVGAAVIRSALGNGVGVVQAVELNELVELLLFPSCRSAAGGYVVVKALAVAEHGGLVVPQLAYLLLKVAHLVGMACVLPFKLAYLLGIFGYQAVALGYGLLGPVYALLIIYYQRCYEQGHACQYSRPLYLSRS